MAGKPPKIQTKPCVQCGASMAWTRNIASVWDKTQYCSNACRRVANRVKRATGELLVPRKSKAPKR